MHSDSPQFESPNSNLPLNFRILGNTFIQFQQMAEDPSYFSVPDINQITIPHIADLTKIFDALIELHQQSVETFNAIVRHYNIQLSEDAALEFVNFISTDQTTSNEQLEYLMLIIWLCGNNFRFIYFSTLNKAIVGRVEQLIAAWEVRLGKEVETSPFDKSILKTETLPQIYVAGDIHATFQNLFVYGAKAATRTTLSKLIRHILSKSGSNDIDYILTLLQNISSLKQNPAVSLIYELTLSQLSKMAQTEGRLNSLQKIELDLLAGNSSTLSSEIPQVVSVTEVAYQPRLHDAKLILNELLLNFPTIPVVVQKLFETLNQGLPMEIKRRNLKILLTKALGLKDEQSRERDLLFPSLTYVINQVYSERSVDPEIDEEIRTLYRDLFGEV